MTAKYIIDKNFAVQIQAALFSFRFCVRFENSSSNTSIIPVSSWPGNGDVSKTRKGRNSFHEKFPPSVSAGQTGPDVDT